MTRARLGGIVMTAGCLAALGLPACSGDDTNPPAPDGGLGDATIADGSSADGTTSGDGSADGGSDDGAVCALVDAAMFTDAEVQAGLQIVTAMKCTTCHGDDLQGNANGLPSKNEEGGTAYPPDLTPDPVNGLGCWTSAEIERAFLYGIDKFGSPMCNPMPRFGEEGAAGIDEAGAGEVVAYLRSIPIVVNTHVPKNSACPAPPPFDAGVDAGTDAGFDAGTDAGEDAGDAAALDAADGGPGDGGDAGDAGDAD